MKKKYIPEINGIDLITANAVTCAYLIAGVENVHPEVIRKVEKWQKEQEQNPYWTNPTHC